MNIDREVALMDQMSVDQLRAKYAEAFGEATSARNKAWLVKRIAWRLQATAEGDLSQRARNRAAELARDADLRLSPPRCQPLEMIPVELEPTNVIDRRLPTPGTIIT